MTSTKSLCPECLTVIDANIYEENEKIMFDKTCEKHGYFKDVYWSDAKQFKRFEKYWYNGKGLDNPHTFSNNGDQNCPNSCGICKSHRTTTILANIDVTNRCNQRCPVCFANAESSGYIYEPSIEQIRDMMFMLRNEQPVPCPAIQFAGGEPTIRKDIVEIVEMAKEFRFSQIQIATNGVRLALDFKLCKNLEKAGLNTIYLQFDGVTEKPYIINRGYNALPIKLKTLEKCRKTGLNSITLVPTLAKGVNDDQVGDIIRFAIDNMDVVKGINFQPISFTGRIDKEERMEKRITIPLLLQLIEEQTNKSIKADDFYPVPSVIPFSHFSSLQRDDSMIEFSVHPHCGAGTYIYIDRDEKESDIKDIKIIPITRFIDVERLLQYIDQLSSYDNKWIGKSLSKIKRMSDLAFMFPKYINEDNSPKSMNIKEMIMDILKNGTKDTLNRFHKNTIFIGVMHFMDGHNFDIERVKRCGVHYATPDGRVIPFCSYNIIYREQIERKFAKSINEMDVTI